MVRDLRLYWFGLLLFPALSGIAARSASGEETNRPALSPAAKRILAWFPDDTETLVSASAFPMPDAPALETPNSDLKAFVQTLACRELVALDKGRYLKPLLERKVAVAVRAGRNFETVSAFGGHRSEGCAVVSFEEPLGEAGKQWTDLLRLGAKEVRMIRGREVFVFPTTVAMEPVFKLKPWQGTYLVLLAPDSLLCATSDVYLDEVLKRVDTRPADRALPDTLAEWKHVDPSAPAWMIRHIPGGKAMRLIDGVTWSLTKDRFDIEYLPVADAVGEAARRARKRWQPSGVDLKSEIRRSADGTVIVSLSANLALPDAFLATLFIDALQAESGEVGVP